MIYTSVNDFFAKRNEAELSNCLNWKKVDIKVNVIFQHENSGQKGKLCCKLVVCYTILKIFKELTDEETIWL